MGIRDFERVALSHLRYRHLHIRSLCSIFNAHPKNQVLAEIKALCDSGKVVCQYGYYRLAVEEPIPTLQPNADDALVKLVQSH